MKTLKALGIDTESAQKLLDDKKTQLVKYIPAEIVALFIAITGILNSATGLPEIVHWIVFLGALLLTPLYVWRATRDEKLPTAMGQIVISTVAFVIWVFAIGGPFVYLSWYNPAYGDLLLLFYTFVIPLVFEG